ncbi:MAG: RHS repeat-associated core domain-containing protein [Terriglobales bacterium]
MTYDAENRLTIAAGVTYTYDGDGKRVKKSNGKLYWTGMGSDTLAESDVAGVLGDEHVYFNGKRVARRTSAAVVYYYFGDHLGTSRKITNATGTVCYDADYYPYGGERVNLNTCAQNYKFTGKERDGESGLDYFIARHYSSNLGRFLQPDEFAGGPVDAFSSNDPAPPASLPYADITNPQSLNKYSYTINSPLRYTDPNGHCAAFCVGDAIVVVVVGAAVVLYMASRPDAQESIKGITGEVATAIGNTFKSDNSKPTPPPPPPGGQAQPKADTPPGGQGDKGKKDDKGGEKSESQKQKVDNRTADDRISGSLKRSDSYHSEYGNKTLDQLKQLAKEGDPKAQQMKKLVEQAQRLQEKVSTKK